MPILISTETIKGKRERARTGGWNGSLPFGYTNIRRLQQMLVNLNAELKAGTITEQEYSQKSEIIEDAIDAWPNKPETEAIHSPFAAEGLRLAYALYSTGRYSDLDIAESLNRARYRTTGHRGSNPFGKDTVREILQNRFYLGETSYKARKRAKHADEMIPGKHVALVSREVFDRCQEVRALRGNGYEKRRKARYGTYPLGSLVYCTECGSRWHAWTIKGIRRYRDPARERGVACDQRKHSVLAETLESQAEAILLDLALPANWHDRVLDNSVTHHLSKSSSQNSVAPFKPSLIARSIFSCGVTCQRRTTSTPTASCKLTWMLTR